MILVEISPWGFDSPQSPSLLPFRMAGAYKVEAKMVKVMDFEWGFKPEKRDFS